MTPAGTASTLALGAAPHDFRGGAEALARVVRDVHEGRPRRAAAGADGGRRR